MKISIMTTRLVALLCLCACVHMAENCGENPLDEYMRMSKKTGAPLLHVLKILRRIDQNRFRRVETNFRIYMSCIGLSDVGYFKKRSGNQEDFKQKLNDYVNENKLRYYSNLWRELYNQRKRQLTNPLEWSNGIKRPWPKRLETELFLRKRASNPAEYFPGNGEEVPPEDSRERIDRILSVLQGFKR